jgi:hypothetical protein
LDEYPFSVTEILNWFSSKEPTLHDLGIKLAEVHGREDTSKPAARADFDSSQAIGRIAMWVSGETDFEVLERSDGKLVLFRNVVVKSFDDPSLAAAYGDFIKSMEKPGSVQPVSARHNE